MKNKSILVFDFETTGLNPINDEIIEIGAIKLVNDGSGFKETEELSLLVKPKVLISDKITEITGITNEILSEQGIDQNVAFNKLSNLIDEDTLLVAYNIGFDLGFLETFYRTNWDKNYQIKNDVLDVMAVYKDRHKWPHRLESATAKYLIGNTQPHRAIGDARATYDLLVALKNERDVLNKYVNVIGFNKKYGYSGPKLPHIKLIAQYGGYLEIEKA